MGKAVGRICQNCGAEFSAYPCEIRRGGAKFCSSTCFYTSYHPRILDIREHLLGRREVDPTTGCWNFTGRIRPNGYGQIMWRKQSFTTHQLAWDLWRDEPRGNLMVLHTCDNRKCFNPEHLFLGTHLENMRDMAAKGRARSGKAVLTESQVREIRELLSLGTLQRVVAEQYNVGVGAIAAIKNKRTWKQVV